MSRGTKFILAGLAFWLFETWWFGWNMRPSCGAERLCDDLALVIVAYGCLITIIAYEIKRNKKRGDDE